MSVTSTQSRKRNLALLFAGATLAASAAVGLPAHAQGFSIWDCYRLPYPSNSSFVKRIVIWWGHTPSDAAWACNSWLPECGNNANNGGCLPVTIYNPN